MSRTIPYAEQLRKREADSQPNEGVKMMKTAMDFDEPDDLLYDVCLVVDDRKFYYSKQHLAHHSDYFKTMLFADFKERSMDEIVLNDPEQAGDFHKFLLIINGAGVTGTDEEVTRVMNLSKKWLANLPYDASLYYLLRSNKSTLKEKLELAGAYCLDEYKEKLIAKISSVDQLGTVIPSDLSSLDEFTRDKLFKKSLELHGLPKIPPPPPAAPAPNNAPSQQVPFYHVDMNHPVAQHFLAQAQAAAMVQFAQYVQRNMPHAQQGQALAHQQNAQGPAPAQAQPQAQPQVQVPAQVHPQPQGQIFRFPADQQPQQAHAHANIAFNDIARLVRIAQGLIG